MKINELRQEQNAIVTNIHTQKETCQLCSLGFYIGQKIKVIKNGRNLLLLVGDSKYAINPKCLDCIEVELI
jgi:Fe2+ transport system protein FeoA